MAVLSCAISSTDFGVPCYCNNFRCWVTVGTIHSPNMYVFTNVLCLFLCVCLFVFVCLCLFVLLGVLGVEVAWHFDSRIFSSLTPASLIKDEIW